MTLTNPSLELEFVGSGTIPVTTVTNAEIVRESVEIDWQMMSDLKSTSDKAKISITKQSVAVSRIMSFDGDIKATLINKTGMTDEETLFTGFLSNKYKWSVTTHGEQVLALTIEDNTRLLETVYSDKDQLLNKEFYIPAKTGHPTASGVLVDIAALCGITLDSTVPEVDVDIIKTVSADTQCVDILDQCCFELGYCYKFKADGKLYLWRIATDDVPEPTIFKFDKNNLYAYQENGVIVNKSLRQYNSAIVKYTEINERNNVLIYQDISGQDDTHPYCYIEVRPGFAYPSGLTIAGHTDDQLRAVCDAADLEKGMSLIGIGDSITTEFSCTNPAITADIRKHSANQISVLIKNNTSTSIFILKLAARSNVLYEEGETKIYAGSTGKKYYDTQLEYVHDTDTASKLGNLIYQFYKHSNLSYTFYSKTKREIGAVVKLVENVHTGIQAKLMINARVDSTTSDVYQYAAFSFSPFNLSEETSGGSSQNAPGVVPTPKTMIQYALSDSPDNPPTGIPKVLGSASDKIFGSASDKNLGTSDGSDAQWGPSVPYPVPEGKYVWMRTSTDNGVTWAYSRLTGEKGDTGTEQAFNLIVTRSEFIRDMSRNPSEYQEIPAYCEIIGYPSTVFSEITVSNGTYTGSAIKVYYKNNYSDIRVTAVLWEDVTKTTALATKETILNVKDETPVVMFLGCVSSIPTIRPDGKNIIEGDYFCVKSQFDDFGKGECYRKTGDGWVRITKESGTTTELLECLHGFQKEGVPLSEISAHDVISWFNAIVADTVFADNILARMASIGQLTITEKADFQGTLTGKYLKTINETASPKKYSSQSSEGTGGSKFYWSDVQSKYETYYTTYGTLLSAMGSINNRTALKVVCHNATSLANTVENLASGSFPEGISVSVPIVADADCTTKYRITIALPSGIPSAISYDVYSSGGSKESSTVIISGIAGGTVTVTTNEIPSGKTLKLSATVGVPEITYSVKLHHSDNYAIGTNVITVDGWKYNVNGVLPTTTNCQNLLGTYATLPNITVNGVNWNVSSVQVVKIFNGQNGTYTAPTTGSSSNFTQPASINRAIIQKRGQSSSVTYYILSATWSPKSLTFVYGTDGRSMTISDTSEDLVSWDIYFEPTSTAGGIVAKTINPWDDGQYNVGADNNRWANGYFNNLESNSISATNLTGNLNAAGTTNNVYANSLTANSISVSGLNIFDATSKMKSDGVTGDTSSKGTLSISLPTLSVGQMMVYTYKTRKALSVSISGGTYGIAALSVAGNQGEEYGVQRYNSTSWSGSSFTLGYSDSYCNSIGYIIIYWRKA